MKRRILWAVLLAACLLWTAAASGEASDSFTFWGVRISEEDTEVTFPGAGFVHPSEIDELLRQRPNLKTVNMWEKQFFIREIPEFFRRHPDVDFGITIELNKSHIIRTDMTAYSTLGRQPQIARMHTWYFNYLKNLKALDIGHMNVGSVDFLRETAPLKILIVADCALKDISALSCQTELEYLEIFKNYITDLSPLSGMTELRDLNMPSVRFHVELQPVDRAPGFDSNGADSVVFLMSANAGEDLGKINKIASGGELSRIMLAMKNVFAEKDPVATMIFDEIDTGVSGIAAQRVGEKLYTVSKGKQVLCVTHLPQIAAMADEHYVIVKSEEKGRTYTKVEPLDYEGRKAELARLHGGDHVTVITLASAAEQLESAEKTKRLLDS